MEETISNEIFRQRDKSNNNDIGYFSQADFSVCGELPFATEWRRRWLGCNLYESRWNYIAGGFSVHTVYVETKSKHNTMNSSASGKTFIKMQNQLLKNDDCACFLVEAIAKRSQNIKWETVLENGTSSHSQSKS